jgi:hypothetical protein
MQFRPIELDEELVIVFRRRQLQLGWFINHSFAGGKNKSTNQFCFSLVRRHGR